MKVRKTSDSEGVVTPCEFEQRVCRQLVEALLFEQLVPYQHAQDTFTFVMHNRAYQAQGCVASFGRIRLLDDTLYCSVDVADPGRDKVPVTLDQLLADLPASKDVKKTLRTELVQTIRLCQWNQAHLAKPLSRRLLSYLELESALDEGHPYHPCFKARSGFSLEDHAHYGPESRRRFQLHWLAIDARLVRQNLPQANRAFWLAELGEECLTLLERRLASMLGASDRRPEDYRLLPVHPWQWQTIGASLLSELVTQEHLIHLGAAGDEYQASISVRTLLNVSHPEKASIKLPMNMVNTSSLRTIETHSVCTAPHICDWLRSVCATDPVLQERHYLGLLDEYAGIVLDYKQAEEVLPDAQYCQNIAGQLAVIFRRSVHAELPDGLSALPFPAIFSKERDGQAFIHPWLMRYGLKPWLSRLLDVVVLPVWHLLVHHGIALEAHAQNIVLVHQDGWLERVLLRDFHESLEFHRDFLAQPELEPDFATLHPDYLCVAGDLAAANQYYWMDSLEALRELFVDTLLVFNLAELSYLLRLDYGFAEDDFWQILISRLAHYAASGCTERSRIAALPLDEAMIQTESLFKRKLQGQGAGEHHHIIPNPLHRRQLASDHSLQGTQRDSHVLY